MENVEFARFRKGLLISLVLSLFTLAGVAIFFGGEESILSLRRATPLSLLLGSAAIALAWLLRATRLSLLTSIVGHNVPVGRMLLVFLSATFVSNATPFTTGGLPIQVFFLHREGVSVGQATALTVIDSLLTSLFLVVLTPFLFLAWASEMAGSIGIRASIQLLVVVLWVGAGILTYLTLRPEALGRCLKWLAKRLGVDGVDREGGESESKGTGAPGKARRLTRWFNRIRMEGRRYREGLDVLKRTSPINILWLVILTILYWAAYVAVAPLILMGLGLSVAWLKVFVAQILFNLVQPLIPTPGASGGAELSMVFLFRPFVPAGYIAVFVATWRVLVYYSSLVFGGISFMRLISVRRQGS